MAQQVARAGQVGARRAELVAELDAPQEVAVHRIVDVGADAAVQVLARLYR